jgi:hypothetical protein
MGAWTVYTKPSGREGNVLGVVETNGVDAIFMGGYDGVEYQQDSGSTDAGTAYDGSVDLKVFDFGSPAMDKRLRFIDYVVKSQGSGGINMQVERDYGNRNAISAQLQQVPSSGTDLVWGTGVWGTNAWSSAADMKMRIAIRGRGDVFQPKFNSGDAWHLKGFALAVQGTKRD